uniref:Uncharacterized protein n=1 Tax=Aegilops tauschii TaxID=37682 RepID=M8AHJ0_AEGTA
MELGQLMVVQRASSTASSACRLPAPSAPSSCHRLPAARALPPPPREGENGATEDEARGAQEGAEGYVESVGAGDPAGPPAHHLAVRAGLGDPVFFLLTFVAVTVRH